MRAKLNEIKKRERIINQELFLKNINQAGKPLARLIQKCIKKSQIKKYQEPKRIQINITQI